MMLPYEDYRSLPLLYHLNSEPWMNEAAYTDPSCVAEFSAVEDPVTAIALPPSAPDSPLARLLAARRSCRTFAERQLPIELLSILLTNAYGARDTVADSGTGRRLLRPVPSAGGLYPFRLVASLVNVEGVEDGLYVYNVLHHCLEQGKARASRLELGAHFLAPHYVEHANLLLFLVAAFDRSMRKYGMRAYRYLLLEAGHVAQSACLTAAEHGLGTLCLGGFRDAGLNRVLGYDGQHRAVLYCIAVGYAHGVSR